MNKEGKAKTSYYPNFLKFYFDEVFQNRLDYI